MPIDTVDSIQCSTEATTATIKIPKKHFKVQMPTIKGKSSQ